MATLYASALGGFSGRLGQIVGYQWNGRWCLRTRPAVVRNPRTEAQQAMRARFGGGVQLAARMRWAVMTGLRDTARDAGMTAYNLFCSLNHNAFRMTDGVFTPDYEALRLSTGPVAPVAMATASVDEGNVLNVSFEKNPMRMRASASDLVHLYVYCPTLGDGYLASAVYRRQGRVSLALDDAYAGREVHIYLFVSSSDGQHSETAYGGQLLIAPTASSPVGNDNQSAETVHETACHVGGDTAYLHDFVAEPRPSCSIPPGENDTGL